MLKITKFLILIKKIIPGGCDSHSYSISVHNTRGKKSPYNYLQLIVDDKHFGFTNEFLRVFLMEEVSYF